MAEYIEREATIELLRSIGSRDYRREKGTIQEAIKMVSFSEYTPAADVVEVRHGRWVFGKDLADSFGSINKNKYHLYCSECRNQAFNKTVDNDPDFDVDTPFCPWCGAKMDKEAAKEEACQNGGN